MKVQIVNKSGFELPKYETILSAGMDVRGCFNRIELVNGQPKKFFFDAQVVETDFLGDGINTPRVEVAKTIEIQPGGRCLIPTGIFVAIPAGYEIQCRMRSGLALKLGLSLDNGIGTIDADYRGEIGLIIVNTSNYPVRIDNGERLGQLVLAKYETIEWEEVEKLDTTDRGEGGYGHTNYDKNGNYIK